MFGIKRVQRPHGEFLADGDVLRGRDITRIASVTSEILALRVENPDHRLLSAEVEANADRILVGSTATQLALSAGELPAPTPQFTLASA